MHYTFVVDVDILKEHGAGRLDAEVVAKSGGGDALVAGRVVLHRKGVRATLDGGFGGTDISQEKQRREERDEHYSGGGPVGAIDGGGVDRADRVVEQKAAEHRADGAGEAGAGLHYAHGAALLVGGGGL